MMRKLKYTVGNEESQESDEPQDMKIVIQNKLKSPNILQHTQPGKLTYTVTNNPNIVKQEVISEEMLYHVACSE
jgi:membrane-bound lytic murein transglycosylase MltF